MLFRIPEKWDTERKFSTKDVEYTTDEVVEIMLKAKDYYGFAEFDYPIAHIDSMVKFSYHLNREHMATIKDYLPKDFKYILKMPNCILKLYCETPETKRKYIRNAVWCNFTDMPHPYNFEASIICDYYELNYVTDLTSKFNDLPHDSTTEKVIEFCITDIFNKKETIKILVAYVNKFKKIPDAIMDYLKDECCTSELHEKHFTNDLLDYCSANMTLSLDHILSKYVDDYDKIQVDKDVKSMLLAFKTLHEDLPNDNKKHYKVAKELIDNILNHPGFSKYVNLAN